MDTNTNLEKSKISDEINLFDLFLPLYKARFFLLKACLLAFVIVTILFVSNLFLFKTSMVKIITADGLSFEDFSVIKSEMKQESLFAKNGEYLKNADLLYKTDINKHEFLLNKDHFVGYYDEENKWVKRAVNTFFIQYQKPFNAEDDLILKDGVIDLFVYYQKLKSISSFIVSGYNLYIDNSKNLATITRQFEKNSETLEKLNSFLKVYPSLIRTNFTLNDKITPVEIQIMSTELEQANLIQSTEDILLNRLKFNFYQSLYNKYSNPRVYLDAINDIPAQYKIINELILADIEKEYANTIENFNFTQIETKLTKENMIEIFQLEKAQLILALKNNLNRIEIDSKYPTEETVQVASGIATKNLVVIFIGLLFLAVLAVYAMELLKSFKAKLEKV